LLHATDGMGARTTWSVEIVDFTALVRAVAGGQVSQDALSPNIPWLNQRARQLKHELAIPGCAARDKTSVVVRKEK
jgi:hypothetical protein